MWLCGVDGLDGEECEVRLLEVVAVRQEARVKEERAVVLLSDDVRVGCW